MKQTIYLLIGLFVWVACQTGSKQTRSIIVYGSDNCHHCVEFKVKLDSLGFTYDFRDVEFNQMMNDEMVSKVRASGEMGGFKYPVVDIEGDILIAPEIQAVLDIM